MTALRNLDDLAEKLIEMSGLFIDQMMNEKDPKLAHLYLIQSRTCLAIAKSKKKLQGVYEAINDGEHTMSNIALDLPDESEED